MYVQTEGQNSAVLQTHRSVFSQSIQAGLLTNFFPVLPRVKIYLHCQVFWGGTVMSTGKYLLFNSTECISFQIKPILGTLALEKLYTNYSWVWSPI